MEENNYCFTESEIERPREAIIELMDMMIKHNLTDFSGGNVALRVSDKIYITQRHSADQFRCKLKPDQIIVTDLNGNVIEGITEKISREGDLHFGILKRFPEYNCILHGNSFYSPLIVSAGLPVTGITEVAQYYNIKNIPVTPENVPNLSDEENRTVWNYFEELKKRGEAPVVIMPYHGIIVAGKDANEAFSLFHAVETNSKFILFQNLLKTSAVVNSVFSKISGTINSGKPGSVEQSIPDKNISQANAGDLSNTQFTENIPQTNKENNTIAEPVKSQSGPVTVEEKAYKVGKEAKIFTAEDLDEIVKDTSIKKIIIAEGVKVTDFAETRADAMGVQLLKE